MTGWWSVGRARVRSLMRSPGFLVISVLTLVAGIGANTVIFSLANWALFRPLPAVADPGELVSITLRHRGTDDYAPFSHPTALRLLEGSSALSSAAAHATLPADVLPADGGLARRVSAQLVTPGFFATLGVTPSLGRDFRPEEGDPATVHRVAVVSHRFWTDHLGGDPGALGTTLRLNDDPYEVVGVAPRGFLGTSRTRGASIWIPSSAAPVFLSRVPPNVLSSEQVPLWLQLVGRPALPGMGPDDVAIQLARAAPTLERRELEVRVDRNVGIPQGLRARLGRTLSILGALVVLLLVLTTANLANLLLSRVVRRERETLVKRALGASSFRLTADLVAESALLGLVGGGLALISAWGVLEVLEGVRLTTWFPPIRDVPLDLTVLGFNLAVALGTAAVASVAAAVTLQHFSTSRALRSGSGISPGSAFFRRGAVSLQVALSLILVLAAGLLVRSLDRVQDFRLGFDPDEVLAFSLNPGVQGYDAPEADRLFRELRAALESLPAVESADFTWLAPLGARRYSEEVAALGAESEDVRVTVDANMVSPGLFRTLDIELLEGRSFDDREFRRSERPEEGAVVINRTLAEALFPDGPAVGRRLRNFGRRERFFEVIGVVDDARLVDARETAGPQVFDPFGNGYRTTSATFVVRGRNASEPLLPVIRREVRERAPGLPILEAGTLRSAVDESLAEERLLARLTPIFAALALVLAVAGLYGLVSEAVQRRRHEFGVRTALGARGGQILGLVLLDSFRVVGIGAVLGLVGATQLGRLLGSHLLGMEVLDALTFLGATAVLLGAGLVAAIVPALRSTRVDPVEVLRAD